MAIKQPRYQKYRKSRNLLSIVNRSGVTGTTVNYRIQDGTISITGTVGPATAVAYHTSTDKISVTTGTAYALPDWVVEGKKYTVTRADGEFNAGSYGRFYFFDGDGKSLATYRMNTSSTFKRLTFTVPDGARYIQFQHLLSSNYGEIDDSYRLQIEEGEISHPYEPYGVKIQDGIGENADIVPFHGDHEPVEVVVGRKSRNLITFPYQQRSTTINGVTFKVYNNGEIEMSGTATDRISFYIHGTDVAHRLNLREHIGTVATYSYICLSGDDLGFTVDAWTNSWGTLLSGGSTCMHNMHSRTGLINECDYAILAIQISEGKTVNSMISPQLELGNQATPYEPYGLNGTVIDTIYSPRTETKSGSTIEFEDSYNHKAEVSIDGKSEQKQLSGKNILNIPDGKYTGNRNVSMTVKNGVITFSGVASENGSTNIPLPSPLALDANTTYAIQTDHVSGVSNNLSLYNVNWTGAIDTSGTKNEWVKTPKTDVPCDIYRVGFWIEGGKDYTGKTARVMVEKGNVVHDYEPYCGGIPSPNTEYPQSIESVDSVELASRGRNLLNPDKIRQAQYSGGVPTIPTWMTSKISFPFTGNQKTYGVGYVVNAKKGETYTAYYLGDDEGAAVSLAVYEDETKIVSSSNRIAYLDGGSKRKKASYTADKDCIILFLFASWYYGDTIVTYRTEECMIVRGDTPHHYEPYHNETRTIDLQSNELRSLPDGTKDELHIYRDGRIEIIQKSLKISPDKWTIDSDGSRLYANIPSSLGLVSRLDRTLNPTMDKYGLSNKVCLAYQAGTYNANEPCFAIVNMGDFPRIYVADGKGGVDTNADWLEDLYFLIPLETPQTIQLPSIDPIPSYYPTTILSADGTDITAHVLVVDDE